MSYLEIYKDDKVNPLYLHPTHERFKETAKIVSGTVLDIGCGNGDLKEYLQDCEYTGIDGVKWVAEQWGNMHCDLFDYYEKHDWVVALGVLETSNDICWMANKLKTLCIKGLITSFYKSVRPPFKSYTKEQIIKAFGNVKFIEIGNHDNNMVILKC